MNDQKDFLPAEEPEATPNVPTAEAAAEIMRQFLWTDVETRTKIESLGISITPSNFYSTVPSVSDIENSFEYQGDSKPYLDEQIFDADFLLSELLQLTEHSKGFNPPIEGNEADCENYFWGNSQFSYSDAMSYFAMIRAIKPQHVVEIGSGFSSLVALQALRENARGTLTCIEPFPRPFLESRQDFSLEKVRAQDVTAEHLNAILSDGDILFIDSTHTVKSGSDCLHIYLRLLPQIKKNIYVHVHDVFLPFAMPKQWLIEHHIYWTEQYLLLAFLTDNPKAKVIFGSAYHQAQNGNALKAFMHGQYESGGGSFWFKYSGKSIS